MKNLVCLAFFALASFMGEAQEVRHAADRLPAVLERVPRLRVSVAFAQDRLVPGDTIPVQINVYDAAGKPFTRRQVLHLDLINEKGETVQRQNILLPDGTADSYLALPITLAPGGYLVAGYTEFMRNYGEDTFYRREIEVITDRSMRRPAVQPAIGLFPEGGSLVAQAMNRIIIRYQGLSLGSAIEIRGSASGLMSTAYVTTAGVGYADISPQPGERIEAKHSLVSGVIDVSEGKHVALRFVGNAKEPHITAHLPAEKIVRRNQLAVVLIGQGKVERLNRIGTASDSIRFSISGERTAGLYQAVALDEEGNELAKRFIRLGNDEHRVVVSPIKAGLALRESSEATVSVVDALGRSVAGKFTAELVDQRAIVQTADPDPIDLLLGPDPVGLAVGRNISVQERDLLLSTRTGSWLPKGWSDRNYEPAYAFQSVLRFSGSIQRNNGQQLRDSTTIMLFLQRRMLGYEVDVKNGRFDFPVLFDFRGEDELFYVVHRKDSLVKDVRIIFDYDTISTLRPVALQAQYSRDPFADYVAKKRATDRSYRFFAAGNEKVKPEEPNPNAPFEKELRGADVTVRIDDYVVFPTVEEVVREIVPGLKHRRIGNRQAVRVFLYSPVVTNDPILSKEDPLYIIDGHMTRSTDYFLRISPADLISISIVRNAHKLQHFGYLGRNGVVLVRTRKPYAIREFAENSVLAVKGLNEPWKSAVPPVTPRIPDLRILLGREGLLQTGASGQATFGYKTGDLPGNFWIRIEGQTINGSPVIGLHRLEVKMD